MFRFRKNKPLDEYNFCLLDTNFISTILKSNFVDNTTDKQITQTLLKSYINPKDNIICISADTIKELHRKNEIFEQFKKCNNIFKFYILHSFAKIIELEIKGGIIKKEDLLLAKKHKQIKRILNDKNLIKILEKTTEGDKGIAEDMLNLYKIYKTKESDGKTKTEIEKEVIEDANKAILRCYCATEKEITEKRYPARFTLIRNQLFKLEKARGRYNIKDALSDANDAIICITAPYVDKIFTDRSQKKFLERQKLQHRLDSNIEVYSLRDIKEKSQ